MTRNELSFEVEGLPAPQGSKRAFKHRHSNKIIMLESAGDKLKAWRQLVTFRAMSVAALQDWVPPEAVVALLKFYLPRPKSHYRTGRYAGLLKPGAPTAHVTKPDGDKLTRAVFDALTDAGVVADDSAIVGYETYKAYADDMQTGASITLLDYHELQPRELP